MKLKKLEIQSFVTSLKPNEALTVQGEKGITDHQVDVSALFSSCNTPDNNPSNAGLCYPGTVTYRALYTTVWYDL